MYEQQRNGGDFEKRQVLNGKKKLVHGFMRTFLLAHFKQPGHTSPRDFFDLIHLKGGEEFEQGLIKFYAAKREVHENLLEPEEQEKWEDALFWYGVRAVKSEQDPYSLDKYAGIVPYEIEMVEPGKKKDQAQRIPVPHWIVKKVGKKIHVRSIDDEMNALFAHVLKQARVSYMRVHDPEGLEAESKKNEYVCEEFAFMMSAVGWMQGTRKFQLLQVGIEVMAGVASLTKSPNAVEEIQKLMNLLRRTCTIYLRHSKESPLVWRDRVVYQLQEQKKDGVYRLTCESLVEDLAKEYPGQMTQEFFKKMMGSIYARKKVLLKIYPPKNAREDEDEIMVVNN